MSNGMTVPIIEMIQHDERAMKVAHVLALANEAAVEHGTDLSRSLITISEEAPPMEHVWRVHYGSRDFVNRRGGDLIVLVDDRAGTVQRIMHGQ